MRKIVAMILLVNAFHLCPGQQMTSEFQSPPSPEEDFREIVSDTELLYDRPGDAATAFETLSRYNLNFTSYRRRGYPEAFSSYFFGNLDITGSDKYPDYSLYSSLRESAAATYRSAGHALTAAGEATFIEFDPAVARPGFRTRVYYSDRRYRGGLDFMASGRFGSWDYSSRISRKWGRDSYIEGVFQDSGLISISAGRNAGEGRLSVFVMAAPSQRGGRSWSTAEAFALTGNNLYNPAWGWQKGRQRNSKVYFDFTPLAVASYDFGGKDAASYTVTAAWRTGERRRSGLTWFDAANPAADHYMNMPDYFADPAASAEAERLWLSGDPRYTQLDWEQMYESNLMGEGSATYIADERVERLNNFQAVFSAVSKTGTRTHLSWGARARYRRSNFYKQVKDMLGGSYIYDVDQYLIDDQYYGDKYLNDARHPDRIVRQGDRFGYDYDIVRSGVSLYGHLSHGSGPLAAELGANISFVSLHRKGNYEKETFPGDLSFGRSETFSSTVYDIKGMIRYAISGNHSLGLSAFSMSRAPQWENVFLSASSHNIARRPVNSFVYGAELSYEGFLLGAVAFDIDAYYTYRAGETEITRYYDDIYGEYSADGLSGYSVMVMSGIDSSHWGIEAGARVDITPHIRLSVAGSVNSYTYASDPDIDVMADVNLQPRLEAGKSYLKGYICSASPQTVLTASLSYNYSGWRVRLSWSYADRRYVSLNPVRRTSRVISLADSPEALVQFTAQERLPAASVVNLYVSKGFSLFGMNLFASLSVSNLAGRNDIVYGGYEQMRIRRSGSGINRSYSPFPSRYSYYYPRTVNLTLSYDF